MKLIQNMGKKDLYIVYQEKNRIGYQWTRIWNRVFGFKWCMASYKYIKTAMVLCQDLVQVKMRFSSS